MTNGALDSTTIGGRIRMMRLAKEWSQEELAKRVFVTQPAVAQWESNKWRPSRQSQFLLAEVLGTSRVFLFGDEVAA